VYLTGVYVMGMHLIGMHLIGVYIMGVHHRMQPFYLVVRTYLRLLVVAGLVSHFLAVSQMSQWPTAAVSRPR
jgi:hypothetical protein